MRALIIGGGMAGPVTAMALRKAGIEACVYEAYDRGADGVGAFLTLAVNGLAALRELDLYELVRDKGFDTPSATLLMGSGKELTRFPFGAADDLVNQTIIRADLYGVLRDEAVRRGVPIEYGRRLVDVRSTSDGVTAVFADGGTAHGDVLIGADGLRSTVRRLIDPDAPAPRYVPLLNTGGYARGVEVGGEPGVMYMYFGRKCFFCHVTAPDGSVWWFANPPQATELSRAELAGVTPSQWRARLADLFAGDVPPARPLIAATEELFSGWNTYDFPTVPTWHTDRMVIIGDAAHAMSPAAGQGASMAFEDAVTLARCLRDLPDAPAAFAAYERQRRERVERVVATGKRNGDGKALGLVGRLLLPLFFRFAKPADAAKTDWLYRHRVEWETPVG
jgi:2-polyprenyl-6-methoxyphenol hydroxylase-like FAD-dependent oxidoreductase